MWRQQGGHRTGTTGTNPLHPTQQLIEPDNDDGVVFQPHSGMTVSATFVADIVSWLMTVGRV